MHTQPRAQVPDAKVLEGIIVDLAMQLRVEPEIVRPFLMRVHGELWARSVVKDFVSIFAMRTVRDRFESSEGRPHGETHGAVSHRSP